MVGERSTVALGAPEFEGYVSYDCTDGATRNSTLDGPASLKEVAMVSKSLEEIEEIKKLKARYFRLMDVKLWEEWAEVFAEDATVHVATTAGIEVFWEGRQQIVTNNSSILNDVVTVHQGHMPEIEITGEATATGIWAMFDYLVFPNGTSMNGYGHYHEEYVKQDGQWRIKSLKLTRLREEYGSQNDTAGT